MLPIQGPFSKTETILGYPTGSGYKPPEVVTSRTWYRQARPYDRPLTFTFRRQYVVARNFVGNIRPSGYTQYNMAGELDASHAAVARNKCYGKFVSSVADYSQWANNVLEASKTLNVAAQRLEQLVTFARRLKKFDFVGAARVFGHSRPPRKVTRAKGFGKNWLEYHFMWEPAVKDIEAGVKALTRDFSPVKVVARARHTTGGSVRHVNDSQGDLTVTSDDSKCRMEAWVRIVNPNSSLASELGLINLGSVVWEAVPFSFVADWFGNVGQVLASATDFVGKELLFSSTTVYQVRYNFLHTWGYQQSYVDPPYGGPWTADQGARSVFVNRTLGVTGPTLAMKPFKGFSVIRGATAAALLLQFLPKK